MATLSSLSVSTARNVYTQTAEGRPMDGGDDHGTLGYSLPVFSSYCDLCQPAEALVRGTTVQISLSFSK
jgi:hypothetical protein